MSEPRISIDLMSRDPLDPSSITDMIIFYTIFFNFTVNDYDIKIFKDLFLAPHVSRMEWLLDDRRLVLEKKSDEDELESLQKLYILLGQHIKYLDISCFAQAWDYDVLNFYGG